MKICKKCGGCDFSPSGECRLCEKIRKRKYYIKNKDEIIRKSVLYASNHKEDKKVYRLKNLEKIKSTKKKSAKKHPESSHNARAKRRLRLNGCCEKISKGLAAKLLELQKWKCACCKSELGKYHMDHIMPLALGGRNIDSNMQILCQPCNQSKYDKHPIDFMQSRGYLL